MMSNDSPTNKSWPAVPEGVGNVTFYLMGAGESTRTSCSVIIIVYLFFYLMGAGESNRSC